MTGVLLWPRTKDGGLEEPPSDPDDEAPVDTLRRSFVEGQLKRGWPRWRAERAWLRHLAGPEPAPPPPGS